MKTTLLLATALAASLAATATVAAAAEAGAKPGLMTIIVNDPSKPYGLTEGRVAAAEAQKLGYTTSVGAHRGDINTESALVDTAIRSHSVALILDPASASGSLRAIRTAAAAGIPVFLVSGEINEEGLARAELVSNNAQGAELGAQRWVKLVGQKGNYVELLGSPTDNNAATRSNAYDAVLTQYPQLNEVAAPVAHWDRAEGHDRMRDLLAAHPDIVGVISSNDEMALGAIAALREAGRLGSIKVGGFDGSPDAIASIRAGELQYTVLQPVVTFSARAVDEADHFVRTGKTGAASEKQLFDCVLITRANMGRFTAPFTLRR